MDSQHDAPCGPSVPIASSSGQIGGRNCVRVEEPPDSTVSAEEKACFSALAAASLEENVSDNTAPDVNTDAASQVITP
jgi:hypothetical protein